jgi:hypothetical protein
MCTIVITALCLYIFTDIFNFIGYFVNFIRPKSLFIQCIEFYQQNYTIISNMCKDMIYKHDMIYKQQEENSPSKGLDEIYATKQSDKYLAIPAAFPKTLLAGIFAFNYLRLSFNRITTAPTKMPAGKLAPADIYYTCALSRPVKFDVTEL